MRKIKEKKYLYLIAIGIIMITLFIELIIARVFHLNWYDNRFMILRVIADFSFSFIFVLMLGDVSVFAKTYDVIKMQKTYIIVQRIIFSITLMLCLLESIRIEMLAPSRVVTGMNIVVAGAVAQYANLILRKHNSLHKRMVIFFCLLVVMSVFLFGVFYEWIQAIHL